MSASSFFTMTKTKLKILAVPANDGGCAYYRIHLPMRKLEEHYGDEVEIRYNKNPIDYDEKTGEWIEDFEFEDMKWADIVFTQNFSNHGGNFTARVIGKAKELGKFVHYDTDDLLTNIYEGHRLYEVYKNKGLESIAAFIYSHADLVTVTQQKFADRISQFVTRGNLEVVKNAIDYNLPCWREQSMQRPKGKKGYCRFGWVGGIHHEQDLKYFAGVPNIVNQRVGRENCRWDFYGHPPKGTKDWQVDVWKSYSRLIMKGFRGPSNVGVHYAAQPDRYGSFYTNMDVALAPLEWNNFNDSKSEIKVAECGRYNIPLVATDCGAYDEWIVDGETGFLVKPEDGLMGWINTLTKCAKNPKLVDRMGDNLHELTEKNFDINKTVGQRLELYKRYMPKKSTSAEEQHA